MNLKKWILCIAIAASMPAMACTSMIVSAGASADGRPMLWKHRDTSATNNFLYRVENPGDIGYVGLFNGADELCLDEAWMGMNDEGFAIMNTVAYNLPENDPEWADREGFVMARALASCRTVDDFEALLERTPKPLGVRTCFGVMDASGAGAYFETDDYHYTRFDLAPDSVLVRSNYAYSGTPDGGKGYVRHDNVYALLGHQIATGSITPASLTEEVSRSFFNSLTGVDHLAAGDPGAIDLDFVPRRSSTASIVVEGIKPGETPAAMMMWANLGYPPCSHVVPVTLHDIPEEALPSAPDGAYSPQCREARERMLSVFPVKRGNGPSYIDLDALRPILEEQFNISLGNYARGRRAESR